MSHGHMHAEDSSHSSVRGLLLGKMKYLHTQSSLHVNTHERRPESNSTLLLKSETGDMKVRRAPCPTNHEKCPMPTPISMMSCQKVFGG